MPNYQFGMGLQSNPMDAYNETNGMVKQSQLAKLLGQSYQAPQEQRGGLLAQMAQIDPQAASQADQRFARMDAEQAKRLQEHAKLASAAWKTGNKQMAQGIYSQMLPVAKAVYPGFEASDVLDDSIVGMFDQMNGGGAAEEYTLAPGSARYRGDKQIAAQPFAPASAQVVSVPDGQGGAVQMVFDPKTRQFQPPQFPGQPAAPSGVSVQYDGPEEGRAAFMQAVQQDVAMGQPPGDYTIPQPMRGGRLGYTPPKQEAPKESFRTLGPQEVKQLGLPAGTVAQVSPTGQVQIVNKPNAIPGGQTQVIDNGDGTQTIIPAGKTTEDQNKSAGYALRMEKALQDIASSEKIDPSANRPGVGVAMLDMLPTTIANYGKSGERQNVEAAQLDALDAALTLNTGAAYTKEQLYGLRKSYFPQPGDEKSTIEAKRSRLEGLIKTARLRARGAYPGQGQGKPAEPAASGGFRILPD